ncbi:hypothetical protein TSUD_413360 [Trifolium subterraneum]|uniref:DUF7745 domain-containing protein n=1 Tax=Trifolium subterraneum TaxID=3900 RepID=A0A2Z6P6R1_TRISU|nr:hypothetical protein TSUD_413360 [Trifolium subterraneum]
MWEKREEKSLEGLVLHNMGVDDPTMLQKIIRAWGKINKGSGWKRKGSAGEETYRRWVKERVQVVKLPFIIKAPIPPRPSGPIPISIEEADQLKATIAQLNKEKEELQASTQENCELKQERIQKDKIIKDINKRVSLKEEERLKVRECLRGANSQLEKKNQELHHLKGEWKKSQVNGSELREELEGAKRELNGMVSKYEEHVWRERLKKEAMERALARSQFELEKEQVNLEEYKKFVDQQGEICETLKRQSEASERRYRNLVDTVESETLF